MMCVIVVACAPRPSPIPEGTEKHWYGNIIAGEKFSVKIGDYHDAAKANLVAKGFRSDALYSCAKNKGIVFNCSSVSHDVAPFRIRRLGRDGSVYLVIENEKVIRIVWTFSFVRIP